MSTTISSRHSIRSADEIAKRALVLKGAVSVAYRRKSRQQVVDWLRREQLIGELPLRGQDFLLRPAESEKDITANSWVIERLAPLLWAIQKIPAMPALTDKCEIEVIEKSAVWFPQTSRLFIESAVLRPEDEIQGAYEEIWGAHWRVRDRVSGGLPVPQGLARMIHERYFGFNWVAGRVNDTWDEMPVGT